MEMCTCNRCFFNLFEDDKQETNTLHRVSSMLQGLRSLESKLDFRFLFVVALSFLNKAFIWNGFGDSL